MPQFGSASFSGLAGRLGQVGHTSVRIATEFDAASHAGTAADPWTDAAWRNAIADIVSQYGATGFGAVVFGPSGDYVVNNTIDLSGLYASRIEGAGTDATQLILGNAKNLNILNFNAVNGVHYWLDVRDLTVNGNKTQNTLGYGWYSKYNAAGSVNDLRISDVFFRNCAQDNIYVEDVWGLRLHNVVSEFAVGSGINLPNIAGQDAQMTNIKSLTNGVHGIVSWRPRTKIVNCIINTSGQFGLYLVSSGGQSQVSNLTSYANEENVLLDTCDGAIISGGFLDAGTRAPLRPIWFFHATNCVLRDILASGFGPTNVSHELSGGVPSGNRIRNCPGLNTGLGALSTPFDATNHAIYPTGGPLGSPGSAAPVASTEYVMDFYDGFITSSGGTGVSITIKDPSGNVIQSGLATLIQQYFPAGFKINFGAFSVAPTVTIWGF